MTKNELSPRERVLLALEHQRTDRIPIAMVCSAVNDAVGFDKYLQENRGIGMAEYFQDIIDVIEIYPDYIGPPLKENEDFWSVVRKAVSYGPASYDEIDYYPLASAQSIDDLSKHRWPSPDWFDYQSLLTKIQQTNHDKEYAIMVKGGNIFESSWYMRGFEQSFMDMVTAPEMLEYIMEQVTEFYIAQTRRVLETVDGKVDLIFTADDIGGQNGLLVSRDMFRKFIMPYHARLNQAIHQFNAKAIYHTDGAVIEAVPDLIEMGIDVLQALQFNAEGMDPKILKNEYGDRLCFEGGISVQQTLPFGTVEEVKAETRERIAVLGKNGGYILGPSHQIQFGTPFENIAALFDTAVSAPSIRE